MCVTYLSHNRVWSHKTNVGVADSLPGISPGFRPLTGSQPLHCAVSLGLHTALNFASFWTSRPLASLSFPNFLCAPRVGESGSFSLTFLPSLHSEE